MANVGISVTDNEPFAQLQPGSHTEPLCSPVPKQTRDVAIDAIKGLLIVMVCLGHLRYFSSTWPGITSFLYIFHIPLFLALSCSFISVSDLPSLGRYVRRRVFTIVPPFVFWTLAYSIAAEVMNHRLSGGASSFGIRLASALAMGQIDFLRTATGTAILWFLPCLLTCNILYASLLCAGGGNRRAALLAVALYCCTMPYLGQGIHEVVPWGIDVALYVLPLCFGIGLLYGQRDALGRKTLAASVVGLALCGALILHLEVGRGLQSMILPEQRWESVLCDLFCVTGFVALYMGCRTLLRLSPARIFVLACAAIGRSSIAIYLLHAMVFFFVYSVVGEPHRLSNSPLVWCGVVILAVGVAVATGVSATLIMRHFPRCQRLVFGG